MIQDLVLSPARWRRPERHIWKLVCGLPDAKARAKRLLMLRLYVDDSGKRDHSPVQVLAGYLSSAERWAAFNNEWQAILDHAGVDALRMSEVWRLARKHRKRTSLERDHLIVRAVECIKRNAQMAFAVSIPFNGFDHYLNVKQDHSSFLGRPYNVLFYSMLSAVYQHAYLYRADTRLEVVFDEQGGEPVSRILEAMDEFRNLAGRDFGDLIIPTPTFQNDKDALPLQAADLLAWLVRRDALNAAKGVDRSRCLENHILGEALNMPRKIVVWDEARLTKASTALVSSLQSALGKSLEQASET